MTSNAIDVEQLCAYVSRVERLEEEIKDLNADKKEVYGEAKAVGFDVPTLKKVIQRRRKEASEVQEADYLLDAYEHAVANGMKKEVDPLED